MASGGPSAAEPLVVVLTTNHVFGSISVIKRPYANLSYLLLQNRSKPFRADSALVKQPHIYQTWSHASKAYIISSSTPSGIWRRIRAQPQITPSRSREEIDSPKRCPGRKETREDGQSFQLQGRYQIVASDVICAIFSGETFKHASFLLSIQTL